MAVVADQQLTTTANKDFEFLANPIARCPCQEPCVPMQMASQELEQSSTLRQLCEPPDKLVVQAVARHNQLDSEDQLLA